MENKKCKKCNTSKLICEFRKGRCICKKCEAIINLEYKSKNKVKLRQYSVNYYHTNKEKIKKRLEETKDNKKEYLKKNKVKVSEYKRKWLLKNADKHKLINKKYYDANKDKIKAYKILYKKNRMLTDPLYKLTEIIRCRISQLIKNKGFTKKTKTESILGCSFKEFKLYLESNFEPWMNWTNYGNWNGQPKELNVAWDIDHRIPVSTAETEEDIIRLNHYTNLKPLCSYTNRYIKKNLNNYQ